MYEGSSPSSLVKCTPQGVVVTRICIYRIINRRGRSSAEVCCWSDQ